MTSPAPLDPALFADDEGRSLGAFLASRGPASHLVAAQAVRDALPADPTGAFTWSTDLDGVPATARTLHVDSPDDEAARLRAAAERFPGCRVLGLRHHLLPMLAGDRQPLRQVPDSFRADALRRYVIACPARSGSTLLGNLLSHAGLGKPREHLRLPLAAALRSPGVDRAEIWRQVAWRAKAGNVFGSKLIADFLLSATGGGPVAPLLDVLAPAGTRVVALRRPVLATAVSRFVARQADQWHVRGAMSADERRRYAGAVYDFDALHAVVQRNRAENRALEAALARLDPARVLDVAYAELDVHPIRTLERVAAFLDLEPDLGGVVVDRLPVKISGQVDTHRRLAERYVDDLHARGEPFDPDATS